MKYLSNKSDISLIISLIIFLAIARLFPHPPNFVPFTASALFFGKKFGYKNNILIIIAASFISDIFLGFHSTTLFVYSAYIFIITYAKFAESPSLLNRISTPLFGSTIFFIWTNLGVWLFSGMYENSITGLTNCFVLALPFWKNSLMSDYLFYFLFFGAELLVFKFQQSKNLLNSQPS